ncbi:hypothetical protein QVD17_03277 [Tagetes erecta]|uniref:Uncharacterized protein n=1 Tax=Tagetes erecta TaxID=13708 RepID=A0AAD8LE92_TARER|nr:hypothetical protein QVD17_03277 [Tagetes erecta]
MLAQQRNVMSIKKSINITNIKAKTTLIVVSVILSMKESWSATVTDHVGGSSKEKGSGEKRKGDDDGPFVRICVCKLELLLNYFALFIEFPGTITGRRWTEFAGNIEK